MRNDFDAFGWPCAAAGAVQTYTPANTSSAAHMRVNRSEKHRFEGRTSS
jgi:hypothetical protein